MRVVGCVCARLLVSAFVGCVCTRGVRPARPRSARVLYCASPRPVPTFSSLARVSTRLHSLAQGCCSLSHPRFTRRLRLRAGHSPFCTPQPCPSSPSPILRSHARRPFVGCVCALGSCRVRLHAGQLSGAFARWVLALVLVLVLVHAEPEPRRG
ncbi:uncharacterized protein C8Q71DRAFT_354998 [Rhodofomes roseus]|uniref:Secreted protein n=1 Tax=Rhodofomes roseus TaxID=34475 RepID=A0ABQ8KSZ8_9APHY|nr:uncharacterized protein C8Q71DRAFT_354998 [Rhodofomes roseus]KAH9841938.1 hypothetical protein C8Q71DRAFT_354998 [Rhodofomes roseus]